ncbi:branched-chain amino acid ABC transporter substrate-binding protein [Couchioplanes azureus]|uniref:branched-chain amino acid ABC transporter substrate-binding protein n=1 Tax=Couchioplanes caeruleus TaxID=56438 RepID=UPI0016702142|nr:branched-chain amino acid ABC transporter substrate-binding protein [Couchioplanes caeruleus]
MTSAVAALLIAVTSGCASSGESGTASAPAQEVIRLGTLVPVSGRSSPSGEAMVNAARMAVDEANAKGGVLGRRIELVVGDDACDPGTAVTAAREVVARDVTVSVGGYCSSATVPTLKIFRSAGVPMVVAQSNSTDLLAPKYDSVFLISGTVAAEAEFAVDWMKRLGGTRLAVVHDGTSFPVTLAGSTADSARRKGLAVGAQLELSQGAPSYARIADAVIRGGADVVYYTGYYAEANQLVADLRAGGFEGRIFVGDGATNGPLLDGLDAAQTRDLYGTAMLWADLPELKDWAQRYRTAVGAEPNPSSVAAYDAVNVALDAIRRAGTTDRAAVRKAIAETDMMGMSGKVSFNPDGSRAEPRFLLLRADGKGFTLVPQPSGT